MKYISYSGPYVVPSKDVVICVGAEEALSAGNGEGKRREVSESYICFITFLLTELIKISVLRPCLQLQSRQ